MNIWTIGNGLPRTAKFGAAVAIIVALLSSALVLATSSAVNAQSPDLVGTCAPLTEVVAGTTDVAGYAGDGQDATGALLDSPHGVAVGSDGSVYIAASRNNAVRKVDPSGTISTIAGTGAYSFSGDGGSGISAELAYPTDVAVDSVGNVFVVDQENHRIRKIDSSGIITTVVGSTGGFGGDGGSPLLAELNQPTAIAFDGTGALWIADGTNSVIRRVDPTFQTIETVVGVPESWGYSGDGGPAGSAELYAPADLTFSPDGYLYIADIVNNVVRRVGTGGGAPVTSASPIVTIAGTGTAGFNSDGTALGTDFDYPRGVAVSPDGATLYIAATNNHGVFAMNLATNAIERLGVSLTLPARLDVSADGQLFIADAANHRIVKATCETQLTLTKVVTGGSAEPSDFTLSADFDALIPATYDPGIAVYTCPAGTLASGSVATLTCRRRSAPTAICSTGTVAVNGNCKLSGIAGRTVSSPADCTADEAYAEILGVGKCYLISPMMLTCQVGVLTTTGDDEVCIEAVPATVTTSGGSFSCFEGTLTAANMCALAMSTHFSSGVAQNVQAGEFVLSEFGPSGYSASDWSCQIVDAQGLATTVTTAGPLVIAGGDQVTCTITNTFADSLCGGLVPTITATSGVLTRGTPGDDVIVGTESRDVINGLGGNDTICGLGGNDTILGGDGDDTILGGDGNDSVWAGAGEDEVLGGTGVDRIRAGEGDDTVFGGPDRDVILGDGGFDILHGEAGRDSLYGGTENDWIDGGEDTDLVRGQGGEDELFSGPSGNDRLVGGTEDDILDARATTGSTRMIGDSGNDTFYGSEQLDRMWGGVGNDLMYAGGYHDLLRGGTGNDEIYGQMGRDVIDGGHGDDTLFGGPDNDRLFGMHGVDRCVGEGGSANFIHYLTCEYVTAQPTT